MVARARGATEADEERPDYPGGEPAEGVDAYPQDQSGSEVEGGFGLYNKERERAPCLSVRQVVQAAGLGSGQMMRVLVTGSGGLAGVNFVRALRASSKGYYIVGTDYSKYHILYPDVDARHMTPRHDDRSFVPRVVEIAKKEKVDFLHAQPSSEAYVIAS